MDTRNDQSAMKKEKKKTGAGYKWKVKGEALPAMGVEEVTTPYIFIIFMSLQLRAAEWKRLFD